MTGYEYPMTAEERAAADLLREKGWNVQEPRCPKCHGWGMVGRFESWGEPPIGSAAYSQEPCPNGCPPPALYFSTSTSNTAVPA